MVALSGEGWGQRDPLGNTRRGAAGGAEPGRVESLGSSIWMDSASSVLTRELAARSSGRKRSRARATAYWC